MKESTCFHPFPASLTALPSACSKIGSKGNSNAVIPYLLTLSFYNHIHQLIADDNDLGYFFSSNPLLHLWQSHRRGFEAFF